MMNFFLPFILTILLLMSCIQNLHEELVVNRYFLNFIRQFLGCTPVDQAKGIETVKDAIRRLQFSQQMKKAESGSNIKTKKVEITISVDGVAVQVSKESPLHKIIQIMIYSFFVFQEPRGVKILHQFPLHNISYCADEKGVKKFFR